MSSFAVLGGHLFPQFLETGLHQVRRGLRIEVMDREFVELAAEKSALHRARLGFRQEALAGLDFENPQSGLIPGQRDGNVQANVGKPKQSIFPENRPNAGRTAAPGRLGPRAVRAASRKIDAIDAQR